HRAIAATAVLVALVLHHHVAPPLDRDLLGVLGDLAHLLERPVARRARARVVRQSMMLLARRQLQLRRRPVPRLLLRRLVAGRVRARPSLRRLAEDLVAQLGELLLLPHHLELELSQALEPRELLCERLESLL